MTAFGGPAFDRRHRAVDEVATMTRRTKIVVTVGPATRDPERLRELLVAGADVFRVNLSHGDAVSHSETVRRIRAAERAAGRSVAILADLQGPRIRIGVLPEGGLELRDGARVDLWPHRVPAGRPQGSSLPVSHATLARDVKPGDRILVADGQLELRVLRIRDGVVHAEVVHGGTLLSRKGINLPDSPVSLPTLTAKDRRDLRFAARLGVDFVGVSFARGPRDIEAARRLLIRAGSRAHVVAKIERREALDALEALVDASDGVMVARGDLAVEVGFDRVPGLQKQIIGVANARAKPVITATQMLESMVQYPTPTRAEASDVANAILDGTDAVMLSAETSIGRHPIAAVKAMNRIAAATEPFLCAARRTEPVERCDDVDAIALARAAARAVDELDACCVVAFTLSGQVVRLLARERILTPVLACARDRSALRRLSLVWGVRAVALEAARTSEELALAGEEIALRSRLAKPGDRVLLLVGRHRVRASSYVMRVARLTRARRAEGGILAPATEHRTLPSRGSARFH